MIPAATIFKLLECFELKHCRCRLEKIGLKKATGNEPELIGAF
jgi:hypothetical protein